VLVERTSEARDGEIVVALVNGADATLKRLYHEPGGRIRLQPPIRHATDSGPRRGGPDSGARAGGPAQYK